MNEGLFSRLPTEILLQIFRLVPEADLLALSHISERVNVTALSLYLSRRNFSYSDQALNITPGNSTTLHGLSHATFIKTVKYFSCTLRYPDDADKLLTYVRNLGTLLSRMTSIVHFTLTLVAREFWNPGTPDLKLGTGPLLRDAILGVLDRATQISQTVTVLRGAFLQLIIGDSSVSASAVIPPLRGFGKSLLARITRNVSRRLGSGSKTQLIPKSSTMRIFKIHSQCLVVPPLLAWTLHTLNTSTISHLSFRSCELSQSQWGHLLPQIHVPTLTSLKLTLDNIALTDLSRFVTRHTRLLKLDLDLDTLNNHHAHKANTRTRTRARTNTLRRFNLGHITTLTAPPPILHSILTAAKPDRLEDVVIQCTVRTLNNIPYINEYLAPVLPRHTTLGLQVFHNAGDINAGDVTVQAHAQVQAPAHTPILPRISHIEIDMPRPFDDARVGGSAGSRG